MNYKRGDIVGYLNTMGERVYKYQWKILSKSTIVSSNGLDEVIYNVEEIKPQSGNGTMPDGHLFFIKSGNYSKVPEWM